MRVIIVVKMPMIITMVSAAQTGTSCILKIRRNKSRKAVIE